MRPNSWRPIAPRLIPLIDLQGNALIATETQWNQRRIAGFYGSDNGTGAYYYLKDATTTVRQLTESRPLWPMGTPNLALYQRADTLDQNLTFDVINPLQYPTPVSAATAKAVGVAEARAFQADFDATLTARPMLRRLADSAAASLEKSLGVIGQSGVNPVAQWQTAQQQFAAAMFTGQGFFGPQGPLGKTFAIPTNPFTGADYVRLFTFTNAVATPVVLTQATTYYRYFSDALPVAAKSVPYVFVGENNYYGAYTSTQDFTNVGSAIQELALDQSWYHPSLATMKVNVTAPAGSTVYVGTAAPIYQGVFGPSRSRRFTRAARTRR